MRTDVSDENLVRLADLDDILCGVRDFLHLAVMAAEKLSHNDGNAFCTVLDAAKSRVEAAKLILFQVRGGDDGDA